MIHGEEGQGKGGGTLELRATPGGGGFGGDGGWIINSHSRTGGAAYGNLALALEGGSGGGSHFTRTTNNDPTVYRGGGGGGCVAIAAGGQLRVSGAILANGGKGAGSGRGYYPNGGGGSGGGILLSGQRLIITGTISAKGGDSADRSPTGGAGGGGGHILLHVPELVPEELALTGNFDVSGGIGLRCAPSFWPDGEEGRLLLQADHTIIPAGQRLTMKANPDRIEISPGRFINIVTGNWQIESGGELILTRSPKALASFYTPVVLKGGTLTCSDAVHLFDIPVTGWGTIAADVVLYDAIITGIEGEIRITGYIHCYGCTLTNVVNP